MRVMKFGAATVSEVARLREVTRLVKQSADEGQKPVIVCAALPGVTNALIGAARAAARGNEDEASAARRTLWHRHRTLAEHLIDDPWERETLYHEWAELLRQYDRITRAVATLGEHSPRSIDAVAAIGERFVIHLIATALRRQGVAARTIDAGELLITDDHFGHAHVLLEESFQRIRERLPPTLKSGIVPVITGYIGATRSGAPTTLGRGGGDYSATLLGAALGADVVEIWGDVDGLLTADPKIVPEARALDRLTYHEAAEIAALGGEVLHPQTLTPLAGRGIPLLLRNLLAPSAPGTRVTDAVDGAARPARAIVSARELSLLRLSARPLAPDQSWSSDLVARALMLLRTDGVEILSASQSFSERSLAIAVRAADDAFARNLLAEAFAAEIASNALHPPSVTTPVAFVAVVGAGGADLIPTTLMSLGRSGAHTLYLAQGSASASVVCILPEAQVELVVRQLHADLEL